MGQSFSGFSKQNEVVNSYQKACQIAELAYNKKAEQILILDMKGVMQIVDYFVICSGDSQRQVKAVADNILDKMQEIGIKVGHLEGYQTANWVLLDYGDVVVHIFQQNLREFYQLERLWRDVPIEEYEGS